MKREAEKKFKELCATRAGSLYRLVRDSPGELTKVIATNFMAGLTEIKEGAKGVGTFIKEGTSRSLEVAEVLGTELVGGPETYRSRKSHAWNLLSSSHQGNCEGRRNTACR